jgi:hypothetical protein
LGLEEFGAMTEEKWRERHDWVEVNGMTFEMEECEKDGERQRMANVVWKGTEMGGESGRQRRGIWRVKEREGGGLVLGD